MNKQVEAECGKVQVKGKEGLRGMSSPDIEKFIEEKVAATGNKDLMSDFVRVKKGKTVKGESKRLKYCAFLKQRLPAVWSSLTKKKEEEKPPSVPVPPSIKKLLEGVNILPPGGEVFEFVAEPNESGELGNVENEPSENIYNAGSNQPAERIFVPYPRESRAKIPDPASGKLSKRLLKTIETKLRRMKKQGVKLPNFKNQSEMYKFVMAKAPEKNVKKPVSSKPVTPPKRLAFAKGNGRKPTMVTRGITLATGTRLTANESRQVVKQAELMANKLMKNMSPNAMRAVLLVRYAPGNVNKLMMNLKNKNSYENVLNVVKRFETERARVLKNLSEVEPAAGPSKAPSSSFTMIRGNVTLANLARRARAKAAANRTTAEKRALKFMEASARMRGRRSRAVANVKTTNRPVLMNSNSNSNSNSPPPINAAKSPVSSVNSEPNLPNVVRNINSGVINVNTLNREKLLKVAKNVYNVAKPGEKIPFEKANMEKIRKLVKAGVKKIMKGKQ